MNDMMQIGGQGSPYEYTVKRKESSSVKLERLLYILLYVIWTLGCLSVIFFFKSLIVVMILVGICGLWAMIALTWRRTFVEYEFSIWSGELTVSRILGSRSRRRLLSIEIREIACIVPYDDEHVDAVARFRPEKKTFAISSMDAPELYAVMWKDQNDKRHLLCMEMNERALKSLRQQNAFAFRA